MGKRELALSILVCSSSFLSTASADTLCESESRVAAAVKYYVDKSGCYIGDISREIGPDAYIYCSRAMEFKGSYQEFGNLIKSECISKQGESNLVKDILEDGY